MDSNDPLLTSVGITGVRYKDLYPYVCWLPKYRLPNAIYIDRDDLDAAYSQKRPPITPSFSMPSQDPKESYFAHKAPKTPLMSFSTRASIVDLECPGEAEPVWAPTVLYHTPGRSKVTDCFNGSPPSKATRLRKIVSPHPLLASRNPPPSKLADYVPWSDPSL